MNGPDTSVPTPATRQAASGGRAAQASVTLVPAIAIVVADMVGLGVFTSLGFQVKDISSPFALMLLWLVGGVVALCGAFCYAELSAMFPRSSGEYNFLTRSYNPAIGFIAGWLSATVGFAAPVALAAMAFGQYAAGVVPGLSPWLPGLAVIWIVSAVHLVGTRHGSAFQVASTVLKLVMIVAFIAAGLLVGRGGAPAGAAAFDLAPAAGVSAQILSAPFAISLVFVMYSYSGWNAATYIMGEVRDPVRTVPRALFFGTAIVIALYVALNLVFLYTTSEGELAGQLDVAIIAGRHIFGDAGGRLVGALICIGLISTISAMMWIGPRVAMTMGEDLHVFRIFAYRTKAGVPSVAILFQLVVATLLFSTGTFEAVLDFIQLSLTFCSFLTVLGVIKLRITHPELARPYRAWGYPLTPIFFCAVSLFIMYYLVTHRPVPSLAGLAMVLVGLAIYGLAHARQASVPRTL